MTDLFNGNGLPEQRKPIPPLAMADIVEIGNDGFIPDWRLAEVLGYDRDRDIRQLTERHRSTLEARWGKLRYGAAVLGSRGPAANVCLYNRKQALFIAGHSQTRNAIEIQILIIEVFDAWLTGKLKPVNAEAEAEIAKATAKAIEAAPELMELIQELRDEIDNLTARVATNEALDNIARQIARTSVQIQQTVIAHAHTPRRPASKEHQRMRDHVVMEAFDGNCPICWPYEKTQICERSGREIVHTAEYCEDHITGNRGKNGLEEMMPMCRRHNAFMEKHRWDALIRRKIETFFAYLREYFPQP